MQDSIVAPATPNGRGGIAVVRISGSKARPIGIKLCKKLEAPWKLKKTNIYGIKKNLIDSGLVVYFKAPNSYTGEDVVEIHCHGNPVIIDLIMEAVLLHGARVARAGEFTERAFLNQKIDLAQAESVADLISSESKEAAKMALSSLRGGFSKIINETIDRVIDIRVSLESGIDFPEEETGNHNIKETCSLLEIEILKLKSLLKGVRASALHREGFKISIIGPPNSGKSTLINFLSQDDASIVSVLPGTTRDPVKRKVNIKGFIFEIVDTAGIRKKPSNEIEKEGILRANKEMADSDLILHTCPFNKPQPEATPGPNQLNLFTKCDLDKSKRVGLVEGSIYISGKTGAGVDVLLDKILTLVGVNPSLDSPFLARRRHITSLNSCLASLELCLEKTLNKEGEEICAEVLRDAQSFLGEITRPQSSDELLGEIFSRFCIGK